jgi:hypothetical protein
MPINTNHQTEDLVATGGNGNLVGFAIGSGSNGVFLENGQTVNENYTISTNKNAISAGPITIASGVVVTIPSGSVWSIV